MSEALDMLIGMVGGVVVGFAVTVLGFRACGLEPTTVLRAAILDACGPCDHEAECGAFECVVGKEGWQRKVKP